MPAYSTTTTAEDGKNSLMSSYSTTTPAAEDGENSFMQSCSAIIATITTENFVDSLMQSCSTTTTTTTAEDNGNFLMSSCFTTTITAEDGGRTSITAVHPDIIQTLIFTKLDGPTLISTSSTSSQIHILCSDDNLWLNICNSSWPSTSHPLIQSVISTFPSGHRSFFSDSFPSINQQKSASPELTSPVDTQFKGRNSFTKSTVWQKPPTSEILMRHAPQQYSSQSQELISAVDIHFDGDLVHSKVLTTETNTGWFMTSPFRMELLDHKETFPTPVKYDENRESELQGMKLSWILMDQTKNRAVNISSLNPVSVKRHWLTGELQVRYSTVINSGTGADAGELVECGIVVTCEGKEGGELHVREVSMQIEDMDGKVWCGKDSLVILQGVIEGGRKKRNENEIKENYENFLELKRKRTEKKQKREKRLDMMCIISGIIIFVAFWSLIVLGLRSNGSYFS